MESKEFRSLNEAALQVQMNEAKKRVKTQSGSTEHVSDDDLKAAGVVFDRIRKGGENRNPVNIVTDPQLRLGLGKGEPAGGKVKSDAIWSRKHNGFVSPKDFKKDIKDTHDKMKKQTESVEQIDELDKKTLDSYIKKAKKDMKLADKKLNYIYGPDGEPDWKEEDKWIGRYNRREIGIEKAKKRIEKNESLALEYFESYFGGTLNESTSDEDIMEAVYDLVDLCEAVCEEVGLDERKLSYKEKVARVAGDASAQAAVSSQEGDPEQTDADRERIRKAKLYSRKHSKNWSAADGPEAERLTTQFMRGRDKGRK